MEPNGEKPEASVKKDGTRRVVGKKKLFGRENFLQLERGWKKQVSLTPFTSNIRVNGQKIARDGNFTELSKGAIVVLPNDEWFEVTDEVLAGADPIICSRTIPVPEKGKPSGS